LLLSCTQIRPRWGAPLKKIAESLKRDVRNCATESLGSNKEARGRSQKSAGRTSGYSAGRAGTKKKSSGKAAC